MTIEDNQSHAESDDSNYPILDPNAGGYWKPTPPERKSWQQLVTSGELKVQKLHEKHPGAIQSDINHELPNHDESDTLRVSSRIKEEETDGAIKPSKNWTVIPSPPNVEQNRVWHYTNSGGLMGIVQNEAFWATSLAFMNDSQEYNHGLSVFKDCFDEVNSSKFVHPIQKKFLLDCLEIAENQAHRIKIFVLCASLERDSLAQWRGYTAFSAGYAIGLDPKDTPIIVSPHQDVGSSGLDSHQGWAQVLYAPEDQVTFAKDTINFILASTPHPLNKGLPPWKDCVSIFATYMVTNSCYMKHSSFHEEREVRCVFSAISDIDNEAVSYRVTNYGIAPYLSIGLDHQDNSAELIVRSQVAPPLRIQEVLVGPSSHVDTLVIGVEQFLKSFKQDAIVTRSETSFR